jgi:hypothetical protein
MTSPVRILIIENHEASATFLSFSGRKDFLPVEPQSGVSFLILLGAPRFA